jgi:hypothetical protein
VSARVVDELPFGFGWLDETSFMRRCSHALAVNGRVWIFDAVADDEALEQRGARDGAVLPSAGGSRRGRGLLRLTPPRKLLAFEPEHLLVGHGEGVHEDVALAIRDAVEHSRSRVGPWLWAGIRANGPGGTHPLRRS